MIKIENWCGYNIRFIEIDGEWWAILKDICDALKLRTDGIAQRLNPSMLERVLVETSDPSLTGIGSATFTSGHPSKGDRFNVLSKDLRCEHNSVKTVNSAMIGKDIGRRPGDNKTRWMLAVNELGIYTNE